MGRAPSCQAQRSGSATIEQVGASPLICLLLRLLCWLQVPGSTSMDPFGFVPVESAAAALLQVPVSQTSWPEQKLPAVPPAVLPSVLPPSSSLSEAEAMEWAQQSGLQGTLPFEAAFADYGLPELPLRQQPPVALPGTAGVASGSSPAGLAAMGLPAFLGGPVEGHQRAEAAQGASTAAPRQADLAGVGSNTASPFQRTVIPQQPEEPSPLRFEVGHFSLLGPFVHSLWQPCNCLWFCSP